MQLDFDPINKDIFEIIRRGGKKVETRAATPKYQQIKEGSVVIFFCEGEQFEKKVSKVNYFKSIESLLETYAPEEINPRLKTKEEIIELYYSFRNYKEKIEEFGLVAIEVQ